MIVWGCYRVRPPLIDRFPTWLTLTSVQHWNTRTIYCMEASLSPLQLMVWPSLASLSLANVAIAAALALQAMDGKPFRGSALTVQYEEPEAQHVFRRCTRLTSSPPDKSGDTTNETTVSSPWPLRTVTLHNILLGCSAS